MNFELADCRVVAVDFRHIVHDGVCEHGVTEGLFSLAGNVFQSGEDIPLLLRHPLHHRLYRLFCDGVEIGEIVYNHSCSLKKRVSMIGTLFVL